jgi:hypothetical protein
LAKGVALKNQLISDEINFRRAMPFFKADTFVFAKKVPD